MISRLNRPVLLAALLAVLYAAPAHAQYGGERAGTAGFQSLQVSVDPRGAALGQAVVATAMDASSLFWNPALAAQATYTDRFTAGLSTTRYHAETALHYAAGIGRFDTPVGRLSVGLSLQAFDGGQMDETTELLPSGTGRTFGYTEWAAGLTVSQALTDLFSYGVTAKFVQLSTADVSTPPAALFDLGVFYRVGVTGAQLGVAILNFGVNDVRPSGEVEIPTAQGTLERESSFEQITPPTRFLLGIAYEAFETPDHGLMLSAQIANPADNQEQFSVGAEYTWQETIALRSGYRLGVDEVSTPSFGVGFFVPGLAGRALRLDYGFDLRDRLGSIHRVGVDFRF